MADETITPEVQPETPAAEKAVTIDPAEFAKMQAALKEANKEAADRRKRLDILEKAEAERQAAQMSESEKAAAKIKEYETKLAQFERASLIRKIADEAGLPAQLAERLQGSTEEELKADAVKLLELVPVKAKSNLSPTNPGNAQRAETPAEKRERLLGGTKDIWSGGGVIRPD
jgi:hypothetical protein